MLNMIRFDFWIWLVRSFLKFQISNLNFATNHIIKFCLWFWWSCILFKLIEFVPNEHFKIKHLLSWLTERVSLGLLLQKKLNYRTMHKFFDNNLDFGEFDLAEGLWGGQWIWQIWYMAARVSKEILIHTTCLPTFWSWHICLQFIALISGQIQLRPNFDFAVLSRTPH